MSDLKAQADKLRELHRGELLVLPFVVVQLMIVTMADLCSGLILPPTYRVRCAAQFADSVTNCSSTPAETSFVRPEPPPV